MTDKEEIRNYSEREWEHYLNERGKGFGCDFISGKIQAHEEVMDFIDSMSSEPASEDLETENNHWVTENLSPPLRDVYVEYMKSCARHFALWQKQQMMKDAVECEVMDDGKGLLIAEDSDEINIVLRKIGAKDGDKVKLIITIKEK